MRWVLVLATLASACAVGPAVAADPVLGSDACAHCRMVMVSRATAAQIARPGDEPVFFDDLGCLRDFVLNGAVPGDAVFFVADHRTGEWVLARHATFTQTATATPMASGLLAHVNPASRDEDPASAGGNAVAADTIVSPRTPTVTP